MGRIEVNIQKSIYDKLLEMSDILGIDLDELINLSLIDGYSLYWFLYMKKILNLSEEDLTVQFHERYELLQEIEKIESEFESKYPYGHFTENYERYRKFLDYINAYKSLKFIEAQEEKTEKKEEETKPSTIPKPPKLSKKKKQKQKKIKDSQDFSLGWITKKRILSGFFSLISTFLIFWLIRDYLDPIHMLRHTPYNFIGYLFLAIFTLIILGLVFSRLFYVIHGLREKTATKVENQMLKIYQEEFIKLNPKNVFKNETEWLNAYMKFLEAKKRALPFTR